MTSFSERMGIKPVRSVIQRESVDEPLRNALWNIITMLYWNRAHKWIGSDQTGVGTLLVRFWCWHFEKRYDEMEDYSSHTITAIKKSFIDGQWHEVFDILEYIPRNYEHPSGVHETRRLNGTFQALQ